MHEGMTRKTLVKAGEKYKGKGLMVPTVMWGEDTHCQGLGRRELVRKAEFSR